MTRTPRAPGSYHHNIATTLDHRCDSPTDRHPRRGSDVPCLSRALLRVAAVLLTIVPTLFANVRGAEGAENRPRRRTAVVEVFEATRDAVVNISSTHVVQVRTSGFGSLFDDLFDLPRPKTRQFTQESVGSGFVLHADGYIVTNDHVVARTAERKVIFADHSAYEAQVVARDPRRDLAILKIDADRKLKSITLGSSGDLMVGETVIAVGNPLGYEHTITAGIVSAVNRTAKLGNETEFTGLIQTDASINPGNSGGPLLNVLGELVGVNTAIRADAQNIGFAIPVDHLREVLPEMLDVERRYRFVVGLKVAADDSASVTEVLAGSPAAEAGLEANDRIVKLDGAMIASGIDYHVALIGRRAGEKIRFEIQRGDDSRALTVHLGMPARPDGAKLLRLRLGVNAVPMTRTSAEVMRLRKPVGLTITRVDPGSPAHLGGLRRGYIILNIDRHQVSTLNDVGDLLEQIEPGDRLDVDVLHIRGGILWRHGVRLVAR